MRKRNAGTTINEANDTSATASPQAPTRSSKSESVKTHTPAVNMNKLRHIKPPRATPMACAESRSLAVCRAPPMRATTAAFATATKSARAKNTAA